MIAYENLANSNAAYLEELEAAAIRVLRKGWYILGQEVSAFEEEFAKYIGANHCIAVANGLDALILSIEALDMPAGEILVASNTYIATILAIVRTGHKPVLVEPELGSFNIAAGHLAKALTDKTRALCVTHLFGKSCRMDEISRFAKEHSLKLIEDCAQSHGTRFKQQMTGTFGDAGCFSFYPTKNLGAFGDAGAIVTNNADLADRLLYLRNYGSKQKYVNHYIGLNSRMDELQAALLRVKLHYLDDMIDHKRKLASRYFRELPNWIQKPIVHEDEFDTFHIFGIRHPQRDRLRADLLAKGIQTEIHYPIPPHLQKAMEGTLMGDYPIAEELHRTELSLPISIGHTDDDIRRICEIMNSFNYAQ